ncbi:hypothetical protein V8C42DRAFT_327133 [Trichoderma barbatum]
MYNAVAYVTRQIRIPLKRDIRHGLLVKHFDSLLLQHPYKASGGRRAGAGHRPVGKVEYSTNVGSVNTRHESHLEGAEAPDLYYWYDRPSHDDSRCSVCDRHS